MGIFGDMFKGRGSHQEIYAEAVSLRSERGPKYASKLKEAAAAGNPEAKFELGCAIAAGAVAGSKAEARGHVEDAVRLKAPKSKCYLGWSYVTGEFGIKDATKAFGILLEAHDEGDARATNNIGYMHLKGLIGKPDAKKAIEYYKIAAERGDSQAPFNLGALHLEGDSLPVDLFAALGWFEKAASRGNPNAPKNVYLLKEQLKFHAEMAAAAEAAGRRYIPNMPNKQKALRDINRLEALLEDGDIQRALSVLTVTNQVSVGAMEPLGDLTMLANNIAYFTGIPIEDVLGLATADATWRVREYIERMAD